MMMTYHCDVQRGAYSRDNAYCYKYIIRCPCMHHSICPCARCMDDSTHLIIHILKAMSLHTHVSIMRAHSSTSCVWDADAILYTSLHGVSSCYCTYDASCIHEVILCVWCTAYLMQCYDVCYARYYACIHTLCMYRCSLHENAWMQCTE